MESLRDAFTRASDMEAKRDLARQIQERNNEFVAFVTLGEASFVGAVSKNVEQVFDAPFTVFWGLKKK
jgi:peptide/nickel transport system substrate-binding protein